MNCRVRSYWYIYLGVFLLALVMVREVVMSRSLQQNNLDSSSRSTQNRGLSKGYNAVTGGKIQLQASNSIVMSKKSHPTARKVLFTGRAYTTPHTPYAVLPDFQRVTMSPTKPPIPFHFPHPNLTKTPEEIFSTVWVSKLHKMLKSMPQQATKEVTVVFSDSSYIESLLNWLIAARVKLNPPMSNVLVVCLDKEVFNLLNQKDIRSILIERTTVLKPTADFTKYSYVWIIRMVVYRLINYFGYDIISYDTDAIPLQSLQPLWDMYQDRAIVGSAGRYPFKLGRAWGLTMCMGVIRFRSSANMEFMWELMSSLRLKRDSLDDQTRLNYAFRKCGIRWPPKNQASSRIKTSPVTGQCTLPPYQHVRITVLPEKSICRQCPRSGNYYVVHPLSKKDGMAKAVKARDIDHWFLARSWRNMGRGLKGREWLDALTDKSRLNQRYFESRTIV